MLRMIALAAVLGLLVGVVGSALEVGLVVGFIASMLAGAFACYVARVLGWLE